MHAAADEEPRCVTQSNQQKLRVSRFKLIRPNQRFNNRYEEGGEKKKERKVIYKTR